MYRVELKDLGERILVKPRIPYLWKGVKKPFKEDEVTLRISVAPSLLHCLSAWTGNLIGFGRGYLYKLISKNVKMVFPKDKVPDAVLTKEHWILEPAWFRRVAKIEIHGKLGLKTAHNWENLKHIIDDVLNAKTIEVEGTIHVFDNETWNFYQLFGGYRNYLAILQRKWLMITRNRADS